MFTISDHVVSRFSTTGQYEFDVRAFTFVAEHFPDALAVRGADGVRRLIVAGQNRAELSGCRTEQDIMNFIVLQLLLGERFDIDPRLQHAVAPLYAPGDDVAAKLDEVFARLASPTAQVLA